VSRPLARAITAAADRVAAVAAAVSGATLVAMTALVTVEVLSRDLFNVSTLIADEMSGYLLVALTFIGLAPTLRGGGFIRIDTYRARLRGGARVGLELAIHVLALGYAVLLDWYLWRLTLDAWRLGTTSIQVSRTPLWIPQACMAVGGLLLVLDLLARLAVVVAGDSPDAGAPPPTEV
jgi:TRAP-type C4-dicarboxylate transport system permease small subunit